MRLVYVIYHRMILTHIAYRLSSSTIYELINLTRKRKLKLIWLGSKTNVNLSYKNSLKISWCAKLVFGNDVNLHDLFGLAGGILMLMYSIRAKMDSTFGLIEF